MPKPDEIYWTEFDVVREHDGTKHSFVIQRERHEGQWGLGSVYTQQGVTVFPGPRPYTFYTLQWDRLGDVCTAVEPEKLPAAVREFLESRKYGEEDEALGKSSGR